MARKILKSKLVNNILYLGLIQGCGYLLPILILPFLIHRLTIDPYGKMIFYQMVIQYLCVIVDFGFNFSSTQEIARNSKDKIIISKVFYETIAIKLLLFICLTSMSLLFLITSHNKFGDIKLFICYIPQLLGFALIPVWYFQGVEKIKIIALCTIFARLVTTLLLFILIENSSDLYLAASLQSSTFCITAILAYIYIYKYEDISLIHLSSTSFFNSIRSSFPFFISVFSVNLYTTLPTIIVGLVLGSTSVAYYNIANTVRNAMQGLYTPVSQSLFPRVNNMFSTNKLATYILIQKTLIIITMLSLSLSLLIFLYADEIVYKFMGRYNYDVVKLLRIVCFIPMISAINNILGVQTIILHGYKKIFTFITVVFGFINCLIIYPLMYWLGINGVAVSSLLIETLILIVFAIFVIKKKLLRV